MKNIKNSHTGIFEKISEMYPEIQQTSNYFIQTKIVT